MLSVSSLNHTFSAVLLHAWFSSFIQSSSSLVELQTTSSFESCLCSSLVLSLGIGLGMFASEMLLDLKLDREKNPFFCAQFLPVLGLMFACVLLGFVG